MAINQNIALRIFLILGLFFCAFFSEAQEEQELFTQYNKEDLKGPSPIRTFLSKFTVRFTTGYGRTTYKHDIDDNNLNLLQTPNQLYLTTETNAVPGSTISGIRDWLNDPVTDTITVGIDDDFFLNDTLDLAYKGHGLSVPLFFTLFYKHQRYRFGIGYGFEIHSIKELDPKNNTRFLNPYETNIGGTMFKRFYGMFGYEIHEYRDYTLVGELEFGSMNYGKKFNKSLLTKGIYINLGVTLERNMSEYFKLFVRPAYEFKGYTLTLPENGPEIKHNQNAFFLGIGASYSIPKLKRCPITRCHAQIDHQHSGIELRSRRHIFFKKQHPNYGENDPKLIKYKGKNKKKLNPY